jgi:hypothetical protein
MTRINNSVEKAPRSRRYSTREKIGAGVAAAVLFAGGAAVAKATAPESVSVSQAQEIAQNAATNAEKTALYAQNAAETLTEGLNTTAAEGGFLKDVLVINGNFTQRSTNGMPAITYKNPFLLASASLLENSDATTTSTQFQKNLNTSWFGFIEKDQQGNFKVAYEPFDPNTMTFKATDATNPLLIVSLYESASKQGSEIFAYDGSGQQTLTALDGTALMPGYVDGMK